MTEIIPQKGFTIKEWMSTDLVTIGPKTSVKRAFFVLKKMHIRFLPVVANGILLGVVTDRDLRSPIKKLKEVDQVYQLDDDTPVEKVMTRKVLTLSLNDSIQTAALLAVKYKIGGFPIVTSMRTQKLEGVITYTDILRALVYIMEIKKL